MLTPETKKFVNEHLHLIDQNRFEEFYDLLLSESSEAAIFASYDVGQLTKMIMDCGVNPINHMKHIPGYFLANQKVPAVFQIPEGVETIDTRAFHKTNIEHVIIAKTCTYVGLKAFSGCQHLNAVTILNPDLDLSDDAFYHCLIDEVLYNGTSKQFMNSKLHKAAELLIGTKVHCLDSTIYYDELCNPFSIEPNKLVPMEVTVVDED